MRGFPVVLTADKTVMNRYGGSLFYGFIVTAPRRAAWYLSPEKLLKFILLNPPCDESGRAVIAPQGLRRVEAALLDSEVVSPDDLIVAVPHRLRDVIGSETKIIGVNVVDPLGMGPASTTLSGPYGLIHDEANNAYHFRKLVTSRVIQEARKNGAYLVVGGPGAWQLTPQKMEEYGIDIVVVGEAELVFPEIVRRILDGESLETPLIVNIPPTQYPSTDQIPLLRGATVGGVVEVSRGCGRGCRFCTPTLRKLRHRKLEDIIHDVKVNVENGQTSICLHAEDILQYGSYTFRVEHEKVVKLFQGVRAVEGIKSIGVSHAALSSIAASPRTVEAISEVLELDYRHWMGYQTGIETGSPRLMEKHMRMKPYPFTPQEWPDVVERAFAISVDNGWVPCATLIVNLPGETPDDIIKTTELVERLNPYRSFVTPLLYVPMGDQMEATKAMRFLEDAEWYHLELYKAVWRHNIKWMKELAWDYSKGSSLPARFAVRTLVRVITWIVNRKAEKFFEEELSKRKAAAPVLKASVPIPA